MNYLKYDSWTDRPEENLQFPKHTQSNYNTIYIGKHITKNVTKGLIWTRFYCYFY